MKPHHPLTVVQASCHGPTLDHKTIRYALSREFYACAVAFSEAYHHEQFLRDRAPTWRPTMPVAGPDAGREEIRGKMDAPVLVRRHHPLIDDWSRKVSDPSVPLRLAPARWFNGQTFEHDLGAIEVIGAHPNAAIRGYRPDLPRVREYAKSMTWLESHIRESRTAGRLVVVCGDLNYPDAPGPSWAPRPLFERLGFRWFNVGVDWIAHDTRLVPVDREVIGRDKTRQDHPWLRMTFTGFTK